MAQLKALKQEAFVLEYHDSFDVVASRLDLTEEPLPNFHLEELEEELRLLVRMFSSKTV